MPARARQHPQAAAAAAARPCRLKKHSGLPTTAVAVTPISLPPPPSFLIKLDSCHFSVAHLSYMGLNSSSTCTCTEQRQPQHQGSSFEAGCWVHWLHPSCVTVGQRHGPLAQRMQQHISDTHPAQPSHLLSCKHVVLWLLTAWTDQVEPISNLPSLRFEHTHTEHRVAARVSMSAQLRSIASIRAQTTQLGLTV